MRPAGADGPGPALMECCQPLCSAGPERCPLPMVLTEAVPVSVRGCPGFGPRLSRSEAFPEAVPVSRFPGFPHRSFRPFRARLIPSVGFRRSGSTLG